MLTVLTVLSPLKEPVKLPENVGIELKSSRIAKVAGIAVIVATIGLYIVFA